MSRLPTHVEVGRVRRPHGVRGALLIQTLSDVPERFAAGSELEAVDESGRRTTLSVSEANGHGDGLRVSFAGIDSREAAEALRGCRLEVSRTRTPPAPDGSFYYFELAGCECFDSTAGPLGAVTEVVEDGGGLLLDVSNGERRLSIPFVGQFLRSVDIEARRIELELPEGLLEACESK